MQGIIDFEERAFGAGAYAQACDWLLNAWAARPGQVSCLGLRLADPTGPADWAGAQAWAGNDPSGAVSPGERLRAGRFLHAADAARHLLGRKLLRRLHRLAIGSPGPADWPLNPWGRPEPVPGGPCFSISHSGPEIWLACLPDAAIGIDVEFAAPEAGDLLPLLHPDEASALAAGAGPDVLRRLWVRKEAVVKALGSGLSAPLAGFRVATDEAASGWLRLAPDGAGEPWSCFDLPVGGGGGARAVAVRARVLAVSVRLACLDAG